ncbi:MAG: hypothetical protein KC586_02720 [Myxococcales bacterium]|nr:hypothetical protein [Myxococcales bacterium]
MRLALSALSWAIFVGLTGCSVIHGDDFTQDLGCDLELKVRDFSPHVTDTFSVLLTRPRADGSDRRIEAVAIFDPLGTTNLDLHMPNTVRPRTSTEQGLAAIDFFADFDDTEGFSFPGDHSWVLEDACTTGPELFPHNTDFIPVRVPTAAGTNVGVRLCGTTAFGSSAMELRATRLIRDEASEGETVAQAVGFYRLDDVTRRPEGFGIPAVANVDFDMTIEVVADRDRNGRFDPPGDDAWTYSHRASSLIRCSMLPLGVDGCPNVTAVLREPLPACVTDAGDLLVVVAPVTNANRTSTLLSPAWFTPN